MKLLIISEMIAPANQVASIRWTKLGKYLKINHKVEVDVLTTAKRFSEVPKAACFKYDERLADDCVYFSGYYEIPRGLRSKLIDSLFRLVENLQFRLTRLLYSGSSNVGSLQVSNRNLAKDIWGFMLSAKGMSYVRHAKRMDVDWGSYDVIVSSFNPRWTHILASSVKKKYPEICWLADFRDAPAAVPDVSKREADTYCQRWLKNVDVITAVSEGVLNALDGDLSSIGSVVQNGFDWAELQERDRKKCEVFKITYTGSLYGEEGCERDLTPIFDAIQLLIESEKIDENKILIEYAGNSSDEFIRQISGYKIKFIDHGFVSRSEALSIQDDASLLALCSWNTKKMQGILTGKLFEYLSSGVPIICTCSGDVPNSRIKEVLQKANAGICCEKVVGDEDFQALVKYIYEQCDHWEADGLTKCDSNWDYINSFRYDKLADRVYDLLISKKE